MVNSNSGSKASDESIIELAAQLVSINKAAVAIYGPIVREIIDQNSKDINQIESVLDGLMGFAGSDDGLMLFKKLCRHCWTIDQTTTADYIRFYRELFDADALPADESESTGDLTHE